MFEDVRDVGTSDAFDPDRFRSIFGDRPAIMTAVQSAHVPSPDAAPDADSPVGPEATPTLPDESIDDGEIHWAAGARDGVFTHMFAAADDTADHTQSIRAMLDRVALERRTDDLRTLYAYVLEHGVLSIADALTDSFSNIPPRDPDAYAHLARALIRNSPDREPVKLGITLLGHFGNHADHADLLTIGAHDEFTLFALVALANLGVDDAPWLLAPKVHGWGRIHCIERLDTPVEDPARRRWLLAHGWRNTIMTEYTAAICARRGGLDEALANTSIEHPDHDTILDAAANILAALCRSGGPGEDFRACHKCVPCSQRLFNLVEQHPSPKLDWYISLRDIASFAQRVQSFPPKDAGAARDLGWTPQACRALIKTLERIALQPIWPTRVRAALDAPRSAHTEQAFRIAADIAPDFTIDPFDARFARTAHGEDHWYWLARTPDRERFERVLDLARASIDLAAIATGPADCSGFGPAFAPHRTLDWILQELRNWPGLGEDFIRAGLMSPVVRNRIGAARVLLALDAPARQPFIVDVAKARALDPDEAAAELLEKVLVGEREAAD